MRNGPGNSGNPRPMEVWNADLPFDDNYGSKDRPVIVLGRKNDSYDVLMVTTHPRGECFRPMDPYPAGLDSRSHVRTDRLFKIPRSRFNYLMGELSDEDDIAIVKVKYARLKG